MYAEFVGLTEQAIVLIERLRNSPEESRSDILVRALSAVPAHQAQPVPQFVDFGEGVRLPVGERLFLFLSQEAKRASKPDAIGEAQADGFYLKGKKIPPSRRGNALDPAM